MARRVLVVDDDPLILQIVTTVLDLEAYEVVTAPDAAAATEVLDSTRCDIVVSDVMMPDVDGLELCRRIRADVATATIPVVLLTARDDDDARREAKEAGADAYMTKPFSPLALIDTVERLLAERSR